MITFGEIETRIRRDLINDNDHEQYRWSVLMVMSRMRECVEDIAFRLNPWAAYKEDGRRKYTIKSEMDAIREACDANPLAQESKEVEVSEDTIATLRELVCPISDRYKDAIAYLTAAKLLETDDSDTLNAQKAANYRQIGVEYATR